MNIKPKYLSDLTELKLWGLWGNFLWGLENTEAWKTIEWGMTIQDKSKSLIHQVKFLKVMPRKIIKTSLRCLKRGKKYSQKYLSLFIQLIRYFIYQIMIFF